MKKYIDFISNEQFVNNKQIKIYEKEKTLEIFNLLNNYFNVFIPFDDFKSDDNIVVFTMDIDDVMIGITLIKIYKNAKKVKIVFTLILEEYRGKGYNKLLLEKVEEYAKNNEFNYLIAHVRENNISSLRSFLNYGFKKSKPKGKLFYSDTNEKKIRLSKKLT
jgi:GNAT superfamily N-acetyltransferase